MKETGTMDYAEFSRIYSIYFPKMVRFAQGYVTSQEDAQGIVQDLFLHLWERREVWATVTNPDAYLFKLLKNRCIDFYRRYTRQNHLKESLDNLHEREVSLKMEALMQFDETIFSFQEVEEILKNAINSLPEKRREVFILSRFEELKHEEIASQLNISVNTVQNHISAAIKKLRIELKDYLPLLVFII